MAVVHLTEDRLVGLKVRGVYEAPGAEILIKAHFNLEKLVNTRDLNELKKTISTKSGPIRVMGPNGLILPWMLFMPSRTRPING